MSVAKVAKKSWLLVHTFSNFQRKLLTCYQRQNFRLANFKGLSDDKINVTEKFFESLKTMCKKEKKLVTATFYFPSVFKSLLYRNLKFDILWSFYSELLAFKLYGRELCYKSILSQHLIGFMDCLISPRYMVKGLDCSYFHITLSQATNFRLYQSKKVCR